MLSLFRRRRPAPAPLPVQRRAPRLGPGRRIYAIGDVHGHVDLLERAFGAIDRDLAERPIASALVVLLGDLVDRGPWSKAVIDAVLARRRGPDRDILCLKGNHEAMLLAFLDDASTFDDWREVGGYQTLLSYGQQRRPIVTSADREDLRERLLELFPPEHGAFLAALPSYWIEGDFLFVHAGLKPGVPIELQDPIDLLWIREEFLESTLDHGYHVVHGHTPMPDIEHRANRTNIDIGAYATGRLACLVIENDVMEALRVTPSGVARAPVSGVHAGGAVG